MLILNLIQIIISLSFASIEIQHFDYGKKNEPVLIFLKNGSVLRKSKTEFINSNFQIKILEKSNENVFHNSYFRTIIEDEDKAYELFKTGRKDFVEKSQCYQRAHVWSYEWRKKDIYSSKAWLFFTPKYIRKYQFDWWFHVAPLIDVKFNQVKKERVFDIKYASGPLKLKDWTDIFMRDRSNCPMITRYTDYGDYPESSMCYVLKSSMYYYQPYELELNEVNGIEKTTWIKEEIETSYREAFSGHL